jgi:hypothetical protein
MLDFYFYFMIFSVGPWMGRFYLIFEGDFLDWCVKASGELLSPPIYSEILLTRKATD